MAQVQFWAPTPVASSLIKIAESGNQLPEIEGFSIEVFVILEYLTEVLSFTDKILAKAKQNTPIAKARQILYFILIFVHLSLYRMNFF